MLADRVKCDVPAPAGPLGVGSTVTLGAKRLNFSSFLEAFGGDNPAFFVLSDGAGRTITGVWTVNATVPETATITQILWNDRTRDTSGETFAGALVAWNEMPARSVGGTLCASANAAAARAALGATTVGGGVFTAADAAAARAALGAPAIPTSATGPGQFIPLEAASGAAAVLPAGGTWAYWIAQVNASTAAFSSFRAAGTAAGGTTVGAAATGILWYGFCWRIA